MRVGRWEKGEERGREEKGGEGGEGREGKRNFLLYGYCDVTVERATGLTLLPE